MTTKKCPHCGNEIHSDAKKCRYCKQWISDVPHPYSQQRTNVTSYDGTAIDLGTAITTPIKMAFRNFGWMLLLLLVYAVSLLIPYINIGTTIAMLNLPSELAHNRRIHVGYIFDARFRKYMGEYLILGGSVILPVLILSIPFLGIPVLILSYSWSFAPLLLVDKEVNYSEALTLSSKLTMGHKMTMFLSEWIMEMIILAGGVIICLITFGFGLIVFVPFYVTAEASHTAVFYKYLAVDSK